MEWLMMSTFVAPVADRIESTLVEICDAVVALDWCQLKLQLFSSADVQPSALKRDTMVFQVELLEFQPCTNRIGSWAEALATDVSIAATTAASRRTLMLLSSCWVQVCISQPRPVKGQAEASAPLQRP